MVLPNACPEPLAFIADLSMLAAMMPQDAPVRCRSALDLWLGARGGMPAGRRELRHQAARRLEEALGTDGVLDFIG